ncbi:unnamed protein product, partial [Prorocentrum cordatum]
GGALPAAVPRAGRGAGEEGWAPAARGVESPAAQVEDAPALRPGTPGRSAAEEHAALLALAGAIRAENERLRVESAGLVREESEHLDARLGRKRARFSFDLKKVDALCYVLLAVIVMTPCCHMMLWCVRHNGVGGISGWCSSCGEFWLYRSQAFWFLLLWWLLVVVLASRVLLQLGAAKSLTTVVDRVYVGYLLAGLIAIMLHELYVEIQKLLNRARDYILGQFNTFKDSVKHGLAAAKGTLKDVEHAAQNVSPAAKKAYHAAGDFASAHSPKGKACC